VELRHIGGAVGRCAPSHGVLTRLDGEWVFEVLDLPPLIAEPATPLPLPAGPLSVELDAVGFGYPAADKVSRSLRPG
jgi:hypothetical protein